MDRYFDFACGVDRLVIPSTSKFREVIDVDVCHSLLADAADNPRQLSVNVLADRVTETPPPSLGCVPMTIQENLQQRLKRLSLFVGVCCVGSAAGLAHWPPDTWLAALFLFPILAVTTIVVGVRFIRCPRCGLRLGATARAAARARPTPIPVPIAV